MWLRKILERISFSVLHNILIFFQEENKALRLKDDILLINNRDNSVFSSAASDKLDPG